MDSVDLKIQSAFEKSGVRCLDIVPLIPNYEPIFCNPWRIKIILVTEEIRALLPQFRLVQPNCPICGKDGAHALKAHAFVDFENGYCLGLQLVVHENCIRNAQLDNADIPTPW